MDTVTITLPKMYADTLATHGSIGRTISAAIALCLELDGEQADYTVWELQELQQALDAVGVACRDQR